MENRGNKAFLENPKHQPCVSQWGELHCSANSKRNGDYDEYPSLSNFMNELWLDGKWWKEKAFLANLKLQYRLSQWGKHDCSAHNKKTEIITSIQVCLFLIDEQ